MILSTSIAIDDGHMLQLLQKYLKTAKKQEELIKELQTHIKQFQKQLSQIKKGIRTQSNKK